MVDYSKELEAALRGVQCLEEVLEATYRAPPDQEQLIALTSAILVLWRRLRPFVLTMFKSCYEAKDSTLKTLDELETNTISEVATKQKRWSDKGITTEMHRVVLTYEAACGHARILIELYFKIKTVVGGQQDG